jgi:hypothetical protein
MTDPSKHLPIVTKHGDGFYVTCARCGLGLWLKPLEKHANTAKWDAPDYDVPEGAGQAPCRVQ